jgi:hypothetical protein
MLKCRVFARAAKAHNRELSLAATLFRVVLEMFCINVEKSFMRREIV